MLANSFTVDLEDWFQGLTSTNARPEEWPCYEPRVEANTDRLLALMDEHHVRGTFFVLGLVATRYPSLIRRIAAAGHEIGVHGHEHLMVHRLTPERFGQELDRAVEALGRLAERGRPIAGHRAPYFSINGGSLWALDVLRDKGFRYDSSFFPTRNMLYGYPQAPRFPHRLASGLVEFPVSTARWLGMNWPIAGGFYVRTLPYVVIRQGIRQLNSQGQPAILYVHPWELDTGQHYGRVTPRERVTHYHGRGTLEKKLRRLFTEFRFAPLGDLLPQVGPARLPNRPDARRANAGRINHDRI